VERIGQSELKGYEMGREKEYEINDKMTKTKKEDLELSTARNQT